MSDDSGSAATAPGASIDFIREIVDEDLASGRHHGRVATRFPPEPNGYLHIGHAKSICLNFGLAPGVRRHLQPALRRHQPDQGRRRVRRLDQGRRRAGSASTGTTDCSTPPTTSSSCTSCAVELIKQGKAYVDSLTPDEIREYRGTLTEPGKNSPYRDRSVDENLDLFARMRAGEFPDGAHVLRAKIDMASPNINMRDPVLYRIRHAHHHRTGDAWCIYPMYDYAHPLSDAIEGITHSLCTLEFEDHRPLYDWLRRRRLERRPRRSRSSSRGSNLTYTVMSKRKLLQLVQQKHVVAAGTTRACRRSPACAAAATRPKRSATSASASASRRSDSVIDIGAARALRPRGSQPARAARDGRAAAAQGGDRRTTPKARSRSSTSSTTREDADAGTRKVPFSRELYIERDDFMEDPPKKFFRLAPGREVRLRYAYFITCTEVVKDAGGEIVELRCTYDPATRGGDAPDGRKVQGDDPLGVGGARGRRRGAPLRPPVRGRGSRRRARGQDVSRRPEPELARGAGRTRRSSRQLAGAAAGTRVQFERLGYFCVDSDSQPGALVFNRTVTLRDTWAKIAHAQP